MNQHPIPQNVTNYQFRLVGDMTLKQFLELAAGLLLAFAFSKLTFLPSFIRWPLVGIFLLGGFAMAFLPIEERPMDQWLINFIKSVYSPTQFLWKKTPLVPDFFNFQPSKDKPEITPAKNKDQLKSFLQSMPIKPHSPVEQQEQLALEKINQIIGVPPSSGLSTKTVQPAITSSFGIKTRVLGSNPQDKKEAVVFDNNNPQSNHQSPPPTTTKARPPQVQASPLAKPPLKIAYLEKKPNPFLPALTQDLPMPAPPEYPNLVTGMVVDQFGQILSSNVIIEIKNRQGQVVRAVKPNKLGQFFIATPLVNGNYKIVAESPEQIFDIIKIKAEGKIIPAIKIQAKKNNTKVL